MLERLRQHRYSLAPALVLICMLVIQSMSPAFASTVATISGTVTDDSGIPISGVSVTASSPSGHYQARSDAHGFFSITGVAPDTYTVSFQRDGYQPQAENGITAFADQVATVNARLVKSFKTIASVTSRSSTGAFQPGQTADTYSINATQINAIQGNPLNISEKNLIHAMPGVSYTNGQAPSIRGGRSNNVDYEVDGVPYINPYTNANVNQYTMPSFGYQSLQVSPGSEDSSFGNSGVGTINAVLTRGSYPGRLDVIGGIGGPGFLHGLGLGWGTAAPNGKWSNYMSYTAENTAPRYGGNLEPNSTLNGSFGTVQLIQNRDFTNNFVYNFGRDNRFDVQYFTDIGWNRRSGGYGQNTALYNANLHNAAGFGVFGPMCYASCGPEWISYFTNYRNSAPTSCSPACLSTSSAFYWFWGQTGTPASPQGANACYQGDWDGITLQQFQNMAPLYPGQTQVNETLAQAGRPDYQEFDLNSTQKVALDFRPDSQTIASLSYYNTSANNIGDSISIYPFDSGDVWISEGGHQHALKLDITRQLNEQNLVKFGVEDRYQNPYLQSISPMTAWFNPLFNGNNEQFDFINPNSTALGMNGCGVGQKIGTFNATSLITATNPTGAFSAPYAIPGMIFFPNTDIINSQQQALYPGIPTSQQGTYSGPQVPADTPSCGWLYQFFPGVSQLMLPAAENGNTLHPTGGAIYLSDSFTPNARFKADVGIRLETQHNHYPTPQVYGDCTTQYLPLSWGVYATNVLDKNGNIVHAQNFDPTTGLFNGKPMGPGNCPVATFLPLTSYEANPIVPEPRIALSYLVTKNDAVRFSWGRTSRFPDYVFTDSAENPAPYAQYYRLPSHLNTNFIQPFWWSLTGAFAPYNVTTNNNYYSNNSIATTCGMTDFGLAVPCTSYGEQLYWTGFNGDFGKPLFPLAPITYSNFDFSWEHQFGDGWSFKATPWSRRAYDLDISTQIENTSLAPFKNADGTPGYHQYGLISNNGIEIAHGAEFYLTKATPWHGLTGTISASFQHVVQNTDPNNAPKGLTADLSGSANNETTGAQSQASGFFNKLFNVNYVTPFSSSLTLQYAQPKGGWRVQTQWFYDAGYPYGQGYNVIQLFGGTPHILKSSNDCTGGSVAFSDPTNPGSCFSPNIVATRGTNEGDFANQVYSHPNLVAEITLEKTIGQGKIGFTINNLFNEIYTGPTLPYGQDFGQTGPRLSTAALNDQGQNFGSNGAYPVSGMILNPVYQPVATGVAGPLTGQGLFGNTDARIASLLCATCAYIHLPNGQGRSYYVYYQFRLGGSH